MAWKSRIDLTQRNLACFYRRSASKKPHDFDAFLALLSVDGYRIKRGKHITFEHNDFKQNVRMNTLGEGYTEEEIRAVIKEQNIHVLKKRRTVKRTDRQQTIIDIQAKLAEGKGEAYRRWATVENLKRIAKTKFYMDEHSLDYASLADRKSVLSKRGRELSEKINQAQTRLAEINVLKTHIENVNPGSVKPTSFFGEKVSGENHFLKGSLVTD